MRDAIKNRLVQNFFSLGFVQAINSSLQLLVIPHVVKAVGAEGYGVIAVAQVVMIYLGTFSEFGFNQTATRSLAISRNDPHQLSLIFSRVFYSRLIIVAVAFAILLLLLLLVPLFREHTLLYLMAFSIVIGQSLLMHWFFQGLEKNWYLIIATLAGRVLFVILVFIFVNDKSHDYLFLFFLGTGSFVTGIVSMIIAIRKFKLRLITPKRSEITQELKDGWRVTLTNLSMNTCQYANVVILRFFTNDLIAGYYGLAERVYFTAKHVLLVFSQSIYPRICQVMQDGKEQLAHFIKRVYIPFFACMVAGSILIFVFAHPVLKFFSGPESVHSVPILRALSGVLVITCLNIPSTLILLATSRQKSYFAVYMLGGLINIVAGIVLAYFFQVNGTLIAIYLTELFITTGVLIESFRHGNPEMKFNGWVKETFGST